ncbi:N-formylglutamate amidohydrolase [Meridianimarinicoccus aquatilis]|nr:N-formylglutamate amidohydrolase [Fluviibacterium aquatile]
MNYQLIQPKTVLTGVVFASPHSGRDYPAEMRTATVLDERTLRSSEDAYMDLLIGDAPSLGAPLLLAKTPRAFVDLNRNTDELDSALIEGVRRSAHNPRVTSGLGVIPRVVAGGRAIYSGKMPLAEARRRIDQHWQPYHSALAALLATQRATFGRAVLVDCHSMPHEAIEGVNGGRGPLPDVVLGDRFGAAADGDVVDRIELALTAEGLRVARNTPFAGAFIAQRYGRPAQGMHVVQMEIDRALYMNEATLTQRPDFDDLRALMRRVMSDIVTIARPDIPLAAE